MVENKRKCPFKKVTHYQYIIRNGHPVPELVAEEFMPCIEDKCMQYIYDKFTDTAQCLMGRKPLDI